MEQLGTVVPAYCDHYHLYSFMIDSVATQSSSDRFNQDMAMYALTMFGIPGSCQYRDWLAVYNEFTDETEYATSGD